MNKYLQQKTHVYSFIVVLFTVCTVALFIWRWSFPENKPREPFGSATEQVILGKSTRSGTVALIAFNRPRSDESVSFALKDYIRRKRSEGRFSEPYARLLEKACTNLPGCFADIRSQYPAGLAERRKSDLLELIARFDLTYLTEGLPLLENDEERQYVLSGVVGNASKKDPASLVKYAIEHLDKRNKENAILSSIPTLAKNGDIELATSALSHITTPAWRKEGIGSIARAIAEQNDSVSIAVRWAQQLAVADERAVAEIAILGTKGKNMTPENLVQMMGGLQEPRTQTALVSMVVTKLAAQDTNAALDWVKSLPAEMAAKVQPTLAIEVARTDIEKGTQIALAMPGDDRTAEFSQTLTIDQIANVIYKKDPKQLSEWVATLPSSLSQRKTGTLAANWIKDDPASAKKWIMGLPDGEVREIALGSAATVFGLDSAISAELISLMKNPKRRALAQRQIDIVAASLKAQGRYEQFLKK